MRLRWLVLCVLCLIPFWGSAQSPIAWFDFGPGISSSKILVDGSGNIYWVGKSISFQGYNLRVIKYSATGSLLGEGSVQFITSDTDVQVVEPSLSGSQIYAGLLSDSTMLAAFNVDDMSLVWQKQESGASLHGIFATPTQLYTVERNSISPRVHRRSTATGNVVVTTTMAGLGAVHQTIGDAAGTIYVAGSGANTSTSHLVRIDAMSTVYSVSVPFVLYGPRTATAIALNPTSQEVMVAYSAEVVGLGVTNALLFRGKMSDGTGSAWSFDASDSDHITTILPQTDGGAVVTMRYSNPTLDGTRIIRRNSGGTLWSVDHSRDLYMDITGAEDSTGNVVIARHEPLAPAYNLLLEKRDRSTGNLIWQVDQGDATPYDLAVTPTGGPLLAQANYLYVFQGLLIGFDRTSVIGGNSVLLQVLLTRPTPVANLPVLLFSNAVELPVPTSVNLPLGSTGTTVPINTLGVTATKVATVNVRHVGYITQKAVTLLPPLLSTLVVSPVQVTGGTSTQGTVTIAGDAPTGGWLVNLSSGNAAASVPSTVTIPATLSTAQFVISTNSVSANTGIVISASKNSVTRTAFMAVNAPALSTFTLGSSSVVGGQNGSLTVTLNALAPTGGYSISLISGAPGLVVLPSSTAVPVGTNTRNLSFATTDVTSTINVTLVAHRGPVLRTQTLTLTP